MPDKKSSEILKELNSQQKQAVTWEEGPLLVIAGAGTGKTRVITRKIAYLIATKKVKPQEILALTFTDKAAAEMEERVDLLVPYGYTDMWICTFHAFGDRILRENALEVSLAPDFQVLTRAEQIILFREHLFEFPLDYYRPLSDPTRYINSMVTLISRAKDEDISPQEYLSYAKKLEKEAGNNPQDKGLQEFAIQQKEIARVFEKYQELLLKNNKVDFGNQVFLTLRLLREHPLILKKYQQQFKYILVDEFQDTNYAQLQLVQLLAAAHKNIVVAADDDQSIYHFRGAAYSNILKFLETYPKAKNVVISKNYRSPQRILDSAYRLIQFNNPDRLEERCKIDKKLIGRAKGGKTIEHLHFDTLSSEADKVAEIIKEKADNGTYNYGDFAILVRSNNDADAFLRALNMKGIPWQFSGNQGLYDRSEIRLLVAFLRSIADLGDSASLYHLTSSPEIYALNMVNLMSCMNYARRKNLSLYRVFCKLKNIPELNEQLSDKFKQRVEEIVTDIDKYLELARELSTGRVLYLFLQQSGYLKRLVKTENLENEIKVQNLAKFFNILKNFEGISEDNRVYTFVNYLDMLLSAGDDPAVAQADIDAQAVNVLTVHKAKGLEFPVVFLANLVSGRFPWPRRKDPIELPEELLKDILPSGDFHIQEERRLFYVGMTRTEKELYFTSGRDYGGKRPRKLSQFVMEALDLSPVQPKAAETTAREAIERFAPLPPASLPEKLAPISDDELLTLSYLQVDDYLTCPLKYKYVHILRVPVLQHHTVAYGKAVHETILDYYRHKMNKMVLSEDKLIAKFKTHWINEGFLSREHEEQRFKTGVAALQRFYRNEEKRKKLPAYVEKEFTFIIGRDRIKGRWDRIDIEDDGVVIIDFKTSKISKQKDANKRAKESLQLGIYALAYKQAFDKIPDKVALYFLESGLLGSTIKDEKDLEAVIEKIKQASTGIRKRNFVAQPRYMACQYCAYRRICPYVK